MVSGCSSSLLSQSSMTYSSFMFMFACFGRFFLKNCVVHSSSFSYLLSASCSFGPAGPILVASSFRFFLFLEFSLPSSMTVVLCCFANCVMLLPTFASWRILGIFLFLFYVASFFLSGIHMLFLLFFPISVSLHMGCSYLGVFR